MISLPWCSVVVAARVAAAVTVTVAVAAAAI